MAKVMIQIDGETIEANAQQVAYIEEWKAQVVAEKAIREQKLADAEIAKNAAQGKLAALGLTAEDLKALGL